MNILFSIVVVHIHEEKKYEKSFLFFCIHKFNATNFSVELEEILQKKCLALSLFHQPPKTMKNQQNNIKTYLMHKLLNLQNNF